MSTYVFGDIQGCFDEFEKLLLKCQYDREVDQIWFVGDLINRGPKNLATMKFILELNDPVIVLGNHDLHFLAVANNIHPGVRGDTIQDILDSAERDDIVEFLRQQKLLYHDKTTGYTLVHAGIPPIWDLHKALSLANEVESVLSGPDYVSFLKEMHGNEPSTWEEHLTGNDRLRAITNYFTRLRYCKDNGAMELKHKANIQPDGFSPWFDFPAEDSKEILFGHWAACDGVTEKENIIALDTGCVWGRTLTAMRLEDGRLFSTPALGSYQL
ncbi:MAG TPA: diadenosine tetraphosphatase [Gammaproteobacteria bacterium]|nr:diadenosine tetraphosphatase [Gammaproteobacteria bacterium]